MEYVVLSAAILSAVIIALYLRKLMLESYVLTLEEKACRVHNLWEVKDLGTAAIHNYIYASYLIWLQDHELKAHTVDYEWWLEMVVDGDIRIGNIMEDNKK